MTLLRWPVPGATIGPEVAMATQLISPSTFLNAFLAAAAEHERAVFDASVVGNDTFTDVMFRGVLENVAKELNYCWCRESYTFGAVLYRGKKQIAAAVE